MLRVSSVTSRAASLCEFQDLAGFPYKSRRERFAKIVPLLNHRVSRGGKELSR